MLPVPKWISVFVSRFSISAEPGLALKSVFRIPTEIEPGEILQRPQSPGDKNDTASTTGIVDFHPFNAAGVRIPVTRKSGSCAAMEPRVINATGHPWSRQLSILARPAGCSVARRLRPAPGIVSSDERGREIDDVSGIRLFLAEGEATLVVCAAGRRWGGRKAARRGRKLVTSPACASPDSFILLTQRMERVVGERSSRDGRDACADTCTRWTNLDLEKFGFSKPSGY